MHWLVSNTYISRHRCGQRGHHYGVCAATAENDRDGPMITQTVCLVMSYSLGWTAVGDQERARTDADDDDHDEEGVHDGLNTQAVRCSEPAFMYPACYEENLLHLRETE
jgi:hypothetical protein